MKIVTVIGARPQFIKAAVVSRAIAAHKDIKEVIVHTGQHFDANMSDIFFEEMCIPTPDYNLNVNGLGHGAMTGQMLEKIETVLLQEKPDWVLVYGDTNSTIAGALAAKKLHIKVAHVEAGLRSFNMDMPEEINRILTEALPGPENLIRRITIRSLAVEGIAGHMGSRRIHSVEAGIILVADGCDMTKGRARIPICLNTEPKVGDIHKYSANSIKEIHIRSGNIKPISIEVTMTSDVGFFQIEEVLIQKINCSPIKPYIELLAGVENEKKKQYL